MTAACNEKPSHHARSRSTPRTVARASADERQVVIRLTPLGQSKKPVAERILGEIGKAAGCSHEEMDTMRESLKSLKTRLAAA